MWMIGWLFALYLLFPLILLRGKTYARQEIVHRGSKVHSKRPLLRDRNIVTMFVSFLLMCIGVYGVLSQEAAYATDRGISVAHSALALSLISGVGVVSCPLIGWIADKFHDKRRLGAILLVNGMLGVTVISLAGSFGLLAVGSILVGITYSSYIPVFPSITRNLVGKDFFGRAWGLISMGGSIGAAVGIWLGGYLFDLRGNYKLLWFLVAFCFLAASAILLLVDSPDSKVRVDRTV